MGGGILAILFFISTSVVTYKSGYYKKKYYRLTSEEMPMSEMPDYWAVRGWCNTVKKLHVNADVVFYGNSITYDSRFDESFAIDSLVIVNLGYPGDNIKGMINRLDMLASCHPRKVFLMAGINGLRDQSLDEYNSLYGQLVDSVRIKIPFSKLYLQSILPVNPNMRKGVATNEQITEANNCIQAIAHSKGLTYIDLHRIYFENGMMAERYTRDGIHLKPEAYQLWANEIHKYVIEE